MRIPFYCAVLAAALSFTPAAHAEVVATEKNAFVTRDSVVVDATLRETWLMLISPAEWWNSSHTFSGDAANMMLTPQAGGCFCERIPGDETTTIIGLDGSVEHMNVLLSIPDNALRMRGSLGPLQSEPVTGILTITLGKSDEGTKITFEYAVAGYSRFETPVIAKAVDNVLTQQLSGLSKQLGPIDPIEVMEEPEEAKSAEEPTDVDEADEEPAAEEKEDAVEKEEKVSVEDAFGDFDLSDQ